MWKGFCKSTKSHGGKHVLSEINGQEVIKRSNVDVAHD